MSQLELDGMVSKETLSKIKASDPNPDIKAFTIAHNGAVDIVLNGIRTPVNWIRSAVRWIKNALSDETPIFQHHGAPGDNSHEGRVPIGKVIGSKLIEEGNKIATVAAMYIFPQFRHLTLDVASIEADIRFSRNGNTVYPTSVETITGIALADGRVLRPGFPGATLLGAVQAFAKGDGTMITVDEIKENIISLGLTPEQVFSKEELIGAKSVSEHVRKEKQATYEHAKRVQTEKDELQILFDTQKSSYEKQLADAKKNVLLAKSSNVFSSVASERKLEEVPRKFIERRLPNFSTEAADEVRLKEDLNKFIDTTLVEFEEMKTLLGVKPPDNKKQEEKTPDNSHLSEEINSTDMPFEAYMNPDTNPLIPGGKAAEKELTT